MSVTDGREASVFPEQVRSPAPATCIGRVMDGG